MPHNYLSVLYKHIIQVENKNVELKVGGGGTNIPLPPNPKSGGGMFTDIYDFLQIQTYNHSTLYIRTVASLQWHQLCFVSTKVNDLSHNKLCFVCLLYMGVLQRDPIPKLCFAMVLTIFLQIVRIFCHDLTDRGVVPGWHLWPVLSIQFTCVDFSIYLCFIIFNTVTYG